MRLLGVGFIGVVAACTQAAVQLPPFADGALPEAATFEAATPLGDGGDASQDDAGGDALDETLPDGATDAPVDAADGSAGDGGHGHGHDAAKE